MVNLGDIFPNFKASTTIGDIDFHEWLGESWAILFSHPADFTPVSTTELAVVEKLHNEFKKRGVKVIAMSCDGVESHKDWSKDILAYSAMEQKELSYPIIADEDRSLSVQLGMVDQAKQNSPGLPLTCRAMFIIGPDKKLKLSTLYPATTGLNFDEILRGVDSLQLTATRKLATPANWKNGGEVILVFPLQRRCSKAIPSPRDT